MKPELRTVILCAITSMLIALTAFQAWRVHDSIYETILESFDRKLLVTGEAVANRIDGETHRLKQALPDGIDLEGEDFTEHFNPEDPYFLEHHQAFKTLRNSLNLTYLYTQVHLGGDRIYYVLDGTEDDEWTPPGTGDVLPIDSIQGVRDAQAFGHPWVSDLVDWDQWGLVKAAYTPIYDNDGRVVAILGADVDITIVRTKTRQALFSVLSIGTLTIAIAILVTFRVSEKLTRPIDEIRNAALSIAAGDTPKELFQGGVRELNLLTETLGQLNERLSEKQRVTLSYENLLSKAREGDSEQSHDSDPSLSSTPANEPEEKSTKMHRLFQLNHISPFNLLPAADLLILADAFKEQAFQPGSILCPAGYVPEHLYLCISGSIESTGDNEPSVIFGAKSLYTGEPLPHSLRAGNEGCTTLTLPRGKFLTLVHERPDLLDPLLQRQPISV